MVIHELIYNTYPGRLRECTIFNENTLRLVFLIATIGFVRVFPCDLHGRFTTIITGCAQSLLGEDQIGGLRHAQDFIWVHMSKMMWSNEDRLNHVPIWKKRIVKV